MFLFKIGYFKRQIPFSWFMYYTYVNIATHILNYYKCVFIHKSIYFWKLYNSYAILKNIYPSIVIMQTDYDKNSISLNKILYKCTKYHSNWHNYQACPFKIIVYYCYWLIRFWTKNTTLQRLFLRKKKKNSLRIVTRKYHSNFHSIWKCVASFNEEFVWGWKYIQKF